MKKWYNMYFSISYFTTYIEDVPLLILEQKWHKERNGNLIIKEVVFSFCDFSTDFIGTLQK